MSPQLPARHVQATLVAVALVAGVGTLWVTASADFLQQPGWLGVQRADMIVAPILIGLAWWRRRPQSRFGPLLVLYGVIFIPWALAGSSVPVLYTIGVLWDHVGFLATTAILLAFPAGVLAGAAARVVLGVNLAAIALVGVPATVLSPTIYSSTPLGRCRVACPENALYVSGHDELAGQLLRADRWLGIAIALATAAVLVLRYATGSPPRRRALITGASIGLVWALLFAGFQLELLLTADPAHLRSPMQWALAAARAALVWGFLLALVRADLFAGRVLRSAVVLSTHSPSASDVEERLARALGDPALRLAFWHEPAGRWIGPTARTSSPLPGAPSPRSTSRTDARRRSTTTGGWATIPSCCGRGSHRAPVARARAPRGRP